MSSHEIFEVELFYNTFSAEDFARLAKAMEELKDLFGEDQVAYGDHLIAIQRSMRFVRSPEFLDALDAFEPSLPERSIFWRLHVLCWAAKHCISLDGDFVECGVYRGLSSFVAARMVEFAKHEKHWYLYDSFENKDESTTLVLSEGLYHEVVERFSPYHNIRVVRGWVPESFADACPERISWLHIDMNNVAAEIGALEHLFDKVVPGGIIIFDDYGWMGHQDQAIAEDEFLAKRGYQVLELPTGQGMVLKR